jgi:hypothetical protein
VPVCGRCIAVHAPLAECFVCGVRGPSQEHHIAGRAQDGPTVRLCVNCHRVETAIRAGQRSVWSTEDRPALHRLQGWVNLVAVWSGTPAGRDVLSRVFLPDALGVVARVILLRGSGTELPAQLVSGVVAAINEAFGLITEDWRDVQWPEGATWRSLQRTCLATVDESLPAIASIDGDPVAEGG